MAEDIFGLGKATEALSKELASLISPLLRPGAEETGQIIAEQIRAWRVSRAISIAAKMRKILEDKGIEPKAVPLKTLVPILENCTLEDDEDLASKWANLLASAAAGQVIHPSYPRILAEITPDEARILDAIYQHLIEARAAIPSGVTPSDRQALFTVQELEERMVLPDEQFSHALANLVRLGLCQAPNPPDVLGPPSVAYPVSRAEIKMTRPGENFVTACRGPLS